MYAFFIFNYLCDNGQCTLTYVLVQHNTLKRVVVGTCAVHNICHVYRALEETNRDNEAVTSDCLETLQLQSWDNTGTFCTLPTSLAALSTRHACTHRSLNYRISSR